MAIPVATVKSTTFARSAVAILAFMDMILQSDDMAFILSAQGLPDTYPCVGRAVMRRPRSYCAAGSP
jgi:hypothetical protein